MKWWRRLKRSWRPGESSELLAEFEDTLMLIVDPEQLTSNLVSKLRELMDVEEAIVYLVDKNQSAEVFLRVDYDRKGGASPVMLPLTGKTIQWFCTNRKLLLFAENREVVDYLKEELEPLLEQSMNLACPLVSMDRLIGVVFLRLGETELDKVNLARLRALFRQASVAFENALLLRERLHQNERMFRAEQLATIGQFAAGIAHELRNPLTAIRSTVQFLASDFANDSEQKQLADGLLDEVDRLNKIIGNLLVLARPTDSSPQDIDVTEEIRGCLSFVEAKSRSQGVTLKTDFREGIPKVSCNPAELRQVLLNVIMNGFQAMPDGGTLSICATTMTPGGNRILMEFADQGAGIPPDLRQKVLEPFFTTKPDGTGLGLAICNGIIKRYNGEIWVDQAEGGGTVVRIALPAS